MNQQFEYSVTDIKQWFRSKPVSNNISNHLNEISANGWELVYLVSSIGLFGENQKADEKLLLTT